MSVAFHRGLWVLTAFTVVGLAILIGLGTWQLQRLAWKQGLLERIEAGMRAPPASLDDVAAARAAGSDVRFRKVEVAGRYLHEHEFHLYTVEDGRQGWDIITPLETADGRILFVNRGFVPEDRKPAETRPDSLPQGRVTVAGIVRAAPERPGWFVPDNDPAENIWFWRDLEAMRAHAFPSDAPDVAGFFVDALEQDRDGAALPRAAAGPPDLHNRHLEYALTWYGLAITLIAVYGFYVRSRLKTGERPGG